MTKAGESDGDARPRGGLVAAVAAALRGAIMSGDARPGDRLPSEARLTAAHGVSRTVVREAIASLRADGLVEARQGAGVFVLPPADPPTQPFYIPDEARISAIIEVLELRAAIEIEAAGLAALRRSPAQDEAVADAHRAIGGLIDRGAPTTDADFAFHLAIAEAANNPRFRLALELIGANAIPRAALRGRGAARATASYLAQIRDEHGCIAEAIALGDEAAAREAMRAHLKGSQHRYRGLIRRD